MTDAARPPVGTLAWFDLTVSDAVGLRDFYQAAIGWTTSPVDMGGYEDLPRGGRPRRQPARLGAARCWSGPSR